MIYDDDTLERLGYGEPWELTERIVFDLRAARLAQQTTYAAAVRAPKRDPEAPCPGCGKAFDHRGSGRGWLRRFCSDACRVRFHNKRAPAQRPATCRQCGSDLPPPVKRTDGRGNRVRRYCGPKCARKAKKA